MSQELIKAAKKGDLKKVQELISQAEKPRVLGGVGSLVQLDARDGEGLTALDRACMKGYTDIAKALIAACVKAGIKLDAQDKKRDYTSLHWASRKGHLDIVKALIEAYINSDLNFNAQDEDEYTALHWAITEGHTAIAKALIAAMIKTLHRFDVQDCDGYTTLHCASMRGHRDIAELLIEGYIKTGSDFDTQDIDGESALHFALGTVQSYTIAKLLLGHGACFDLVNKSNKSPLRRLTEHFRVNEDKPHYQATRALLLAVQNLFKIAEEDTKESLEQVLITLGPAINARSHQCNNNTALHVAIQNQRFEVVWGLLITNANIDLKNDDGRTPVDLMLESSNPSILALGKLLQIKVTIAASFVTETPVLNENSKGPKKRIDDNEDKEGNESKGSKETSSEEVSSDSNAITEMSIEVVQPLIDSISAMLPTITNTKLKDYICFELGMLLARRKREVHYEGLVPMDAAQAYWLLSQVSAEDPAKFAHAQTVLFVLCFERHVQLDDEPLERAMFFHCAQSGPENPHKDTNDKLAAALIEPGLSIRGIPGFNYFTDLASLNRFFDVAEEAQQERRVLQQSTQDMAKQIEALEATFAGLKSACVDPCGALSTTESSTDKPSAAQVFMGPNGNTETRDIQYRSSAFTSGHLSILLNKL